MYIIKVPLSTYKHLNKTFIPYKCSPEDTCTAPDTIPTHLFSDSQIPLYGLPLNMDTSLLQTVCFVFGKLKPLQYL